MKIKKEIMEKVSQITEKYNLDKKIIVAYSGGKDSFFSCIVLKELGYDVIPIILDIGFENDWKIQIENLKKYGISAEVVDKKILCSFSEWNNNSQIDYYFNMIKENIKKELTPCTPCYNAKIMMLDFIAQKNKIRDCVFGHHGTDAVTSLLKSYFMYEDHFTLKHQKFDLKLFYKMILDSKNIFEMPVDTFLNSFQYKKIENLIKKGLVGTDEPIRQNYGRNCIVRPLFNVLENEIIETVANENLFFPKAECFEREYRNCKRMTPRELIQKELLLNKKTNLECIQILLNLIKDNLNEDGTMKYDVRRNRTNILGKQYESTLQSCNKL